MAELRLLPLRLESLGSSFDWSYDPAVDLKLELDGASIVLVGSFNPAIVQPAWLARHELIRGEEGDTAEVTLVSPRASEFVIGSWLTVTVLPNRFQVRVADAGHQAAMRDLVVGVLVLLEHTPVSALGINRILHFRVPDEGTWHRVGHTLAPKDLWGAHVAKPGLLSLAVQGGRPDASSKYVRLQVEPSLQVTPGISFQGNEHFEIAGGAALEARTLLETQFDGALAYALAVSRDVLGRAAEGH